MIQQALIYHVASGQAFFSGAALILLATIAPGQSPGRWGTLARTVATCLGLCLVAASATPLPTWSYTLAGIVSVAWLGVLGARGKASPAARRSSRVAVVVVWTLGMAFELPHHLMPTLPRMGRPPVFVVGDSLSAGMGGEARTWPALLAAMHELTVHNLAVAGSGVSKASRDQAGRMAGMGALVIAEIGGNDVLGGTAPEDFGRGLDTHC